MVFIEEEIYCSFKKYFLVICYYVYPIFSIIPWKIIICFKVHSKQCAFLKSHWWNSNFSLLKYYRFIAGLSSYITWFDWFCKNPRYMACNFLCQFFQCSGSFPYPPIRSSGWNLSSVSTLDIIFILMLEYLFSFFPSLLPIQC